MQPLYKIKCTHCGGTKKELQEDRIRNESWYEPCKHCNGTGEESVYSESDYLKIEREKRKKRLLWEQGYLKQHLEDANKKVLEIQERLLSVWTELSELDK